MPSQSNDYDGEFYDFVGGAASVSAAKVVPITYRLFSPQSVVDVGCGQGVWAQAWKQVGVETVIGVDGDYVDRSRLFIDEESFVPCDLAAPLDLGRKFDLVQSLEVAEHIPRDKADVFVDSLVRHGDVVVFSAALPGQGGIRHVNEQPFSYWRDRFADRGFVLIDAIRDKILSDEDVTWWYRYGILVYVRDEVLTSLPMEVQSKVIPREDRIPDYSPFALRLRRTFMRFLPRSVSEWLTLRYMGKTTSE